MVFFKGKLIRLRAMEPEDLGILYTMENDPEAWDVSNFTVPYSRYVLKQYLEESQSDMFTDKQLRLMIVETDSDVVCGAIDITDFVPLHSRAEVGIAILKEFQGRGYAKEALQLMCEYVFCFLHMKQLNVHITADNTRSLNLFKSAGFTECGLLKEWWSVGGTYKDVVLLQKIREG